MVRPLVAILALIVASSSGAFPRAEGEEEVGVGRPGPLAPASRPPPELAGNDQADRSLESVQELGAGPPYPPSAKILDVRWDDADRIIRRARGSDNWPTTWADDGDLYAGYGDGRGFEPFVPGKLSLGFARVAGTPPDLVGVNVRSTGEQAGDGPRGRKANGLLMVGGRLYLWLFHADHRGGRSQLAWSDDHAQSWTECDWQFAEFGLMSFVNFGQDYAGARDGFVYMVSHDGPRAHEPADRMILARVPKGRLADRSAYEFLVRRDADGGAVWTVDVARRGANFVHAGRCLRSSMVYSPAFGRYLYWQQLPNRMLADHGDTRIEGGFGIYDAPEPWGPWTTAYYTEQWDVGPGERAEFPTKWMGADGKTAWLVFSGDDGFSVRRATVTVAD